MVVPLNLVTSKDAPQPAATPMMPPKKVSVADSTRNWMLISALFAPNDLRRPISLVRSVTVVSIIFMMPMPPTRREMPAIAARSMVRVPVTDDIVFIRSFWFMIWKSGLAGSEILCRSSSRLVISCWAAVISFLLAT